MRPEIFCFRSFLNTSSPKDIHFFQISVNIRKKFIKKRERTPPCRTVRAVVRASPGKRKPRKISMPASVLPPERGPGRTEKEEKRPRQEKTGAPFSRSE